MATFTKIALSGSTNGRGVKVAATASAGTIIHTAQSGTAGLDEVYLWCVNTSPSAVKLTIEYGGTTSPDDHIEITVPGEKGLFAVIPGLVLQNSTVVRAFAGTANVLVMHGFVNRIS